MALFMQLMLGMKAGKIESFLLKLLIIILIKKSKLQIIILILFLFQQKQTMKKFHSVTMPLMPNVAMQLMAVGVPGAHMVVVLNHVEEA